MHHALPGTLPHVRDDPEPVLVQAFLSGHLGDRLEKFSRQGRFFFRALVSRDLWTLRMIQLGVEAPAVIPTRRAAARTVRSRSPSSSMG